jgi:hypothetical protein
MNERAEAEPSPSGGPGAPRGAEGDAGAAAAAGADLASADLAALYIQQGQYERGIAMYRALLADNPGNREIEERLVDAEALADLLILRPGTGYKNGYREGYRKAVAERGGTSREERVARLTAWLERVKGRA